MGILGEGVGLDMGAMIDWKDGITERLTTGIGTLFKQNGVEHRIGSARLAGPGRVAISADGVETIIGG